MTNRLKRKLGDIGVDTSSRKANESFCLIGTPLPPLDKAKDNNEFVPLWKQDVRDEKGRRRLHGAFTGGFSAGYFNSVGSKEGWTPQTFVSSRNARAKQKTARPEDFMDDEDLAELRDDQNMVDGADEMDLTVGTGAAQVREEDDSISSALMASFVTPVADSAGARILKKMGWKLGQGIGPRLTWRQRRKQDLQAGANPNDLAPSDDEEANKHTYAPRDTAIPNIDRKDNWHGMGYKPGMGLHESMGTKSASGRGSDVNAPNVAAGFGLGALNDADEDDLDVYDSATSKSRLRTAYDVTDTDTERVLLGSGANRYDRPKQTSEPRPLKPETVSGETSFHKGRPVLAGFMLAEKPVMEDQWFPLPDVPKDWQPNPRRVWESDKENLLSPNNGPQPHHQWKKGGLTQEERGNLLGEAPLPSVPRSVFEYMSQKDRERLQNISANITSGSTPRLPTPVPTPNFNSTSTVEPAAARAALSGFQPFASDPAKHARYSAYLHSQADPESSAPPPKLPNQGIDEYSKELADYAKSAQLFRPVSGAMAGRFTSAAVLDMGPKVIEGLHTPTAMDAQKAEDDEGQTEVGKEESPKEHAARLGMYGPLTREVQNWMPAKLLCKRFGVKDPHPEGIIDTVEDAPIPATTTFEGEDLPVAADASFRIPLQPNNGAGGGRRDLKNIGLGEDDSQGKDTLTYKRPPMDVFKAIFASDEDDEDEDTPMKESEDEQLESKSNEPPPSAAKSVASPPIAQTPALHPPVVDGPVDITTFRPTFVPKTDRSTKGKDKEALAGSSTSRKKDKKKEKVLVSFGDDEGEDGTLNVEIPRKKKKREKDRDGHRERDKHKHKDENNRSRKEEGGEDIWVEKALPEAVKQLGQTGPSSDVWMGDANSDPPKDGPQPLRKARPQASDFM